jgi:hypothetical protein
MNGIWQAMGSAYWNLEDHSASATQFWQLGAIGRDPGGPERHRGSGRTA